MADSMESLVSVAESFATSSTKQRMQIFRNQIPFTISNSEMTPELASILVDIVFKTLFIYDDLHSTKAVEAIIVKVLSETDICVARKELKFAVFVDGKFCKDPNLITEEDFFHSGLQKPGNTSNPQGSKVTGVTVEQIPELNTLGISLARVDYAPYGLNPPLTHPRGTEILVVVEGELYVGFVTSNQLDNKLFAKYLKKGDVFVFPKGLIHFQLNVGKTNAVAFIGLSNQNPGVIPMETSLFRSNPAINYNVLAKAFQVDKKIGQTS